MRDMGRLDFLKEPQARNIADLDSAEAMGYHRQAIREKPFLRRLYQDFYREFIRRLPCRESPRIVELGSGGGFLKEMLPGVITADIRFSEGIDLGFSADQIPFRDESVDAFLLLNVFHHFSQPLRCLGEMARCLRPGGRVIMIEPANTPWRRFVDGLAHSEPFDVNAGWELPAGGPMSAANGALAWIIFSRDWDKIQPRFPRLKIKEIKRHTPFCYIVSGGLAYRQILPTCLYGLVRGVEFFLTPLSPWIGYFQTIELEKQ